jgi:hypothetical protein
VSSPSIIRPAWRPRRSGAAAQADQRPTTRLNRAATPPRSLSPAC